MDTFCIRIFYYSISQGFTAQYSSVGAQSLHDHDYLHLSPSQNIRIGLYPYSRPLPPLRIVAAITKILRSLNIKHSHSQNDVDNVLGLNSYRLLVSKLNLNLHMVKQFSLLPPSLWRVRGLLSCCTGTANIGDIINPSHVIIISTGERFTTSTNCRPVSGLCHKDPMCFEIEL